MEHKWFVLFLVLCLTGALLCACAQSVRTDTTAPSQEIYPTSVETEKSYYSDGTTASEWKFLYDLEENLVGTEWTEYFEDGSVCRTGLSRQDPQGKLLEHREDVYFRSGSQRSHSLRLYDPERDTMAVTEEHYLENGTAQMLVDGIYSSDCGTLLEGEQTWFYANGNPSWRHTETAEKSLEVSYLENGEISHSEETRYTRDEQGNLLLSVTVGYDRERALTYEREIRCTYDTQGRKLSEWSAYGENGARIEQQKDTWVYDPAGNLVEERSVAYVRGTLQYTRKTVYTYGADGLCASQRTETTADGQTYVYTYDQNGELIGTTEVT